jgi:hypothetical protein
MTCFQDSMFQLRVTDTAKINTAPLERCLFFIQILVGRGACSAEEDNDPKETHNKGNNERDTTCGESSD